MPLIGAVADGKGVAENGSSVNPPEAVADRTRARPQGMGANISQDRERIPRVMYLLVLAESCAKHEGRESRTIERPQRETRKGDCMALVRASVTAALLLHASISYANVVVTGVTVSPNPIGVNDTATITVSGYVNTVSFGQRNCTGVEIFFGDSTIPSTDPTKPAATFVRFQPASTANFPIAVSHTYTSAASFTIIVSGVSEYHGQWYQCGPAGNAISLDVVDGLIQSIKSITPAVVNQQTSVVVKGVGSCSQNVQVAWGDGSSSTIGGPVNLKIGGVASHTYASTGTRTVTANGSVCTGVVTTSISVAAFGRPGLVIDRTMLQRLRDRLDRFSQLPPPPPPGTGDPGCPRCAGLARQVSALDQTGELLKAQAATVVKDLDVEPGKRPSRAPVTGELVKQLDGYFVLRTQLLKLYDQAREQPARR
jgi:hypothetical protein